MPNEPLTLLHAARRVIEIAAGRKVAPDVRDAIDALATAAEAHSESQRARLSHRKRAGLRPTVDRSEVARLRSEGRTLKQIAAAVGCSPNHVSKILRTQS